MSPQLGHVLGHCLSVGQCAELRSHLLALVARLDPGDPVPECSATLGGQAIHFRIRPTLCFGNLAVAHPVGEEQKAANLVGLQVRQGLGTDQEALALLDLLVRGDRGGGPLESLIRAGAKLVTLALQAEGLVLDHGLQPRDQVVLFRAGRLGEQDLQSALVGVLGVLCGTRIASGRAQDLRAMPLDELERRRLQLPPFRNARTRIRRFVDRVEHPCPLAPVPGRPSLEVRVRDRNREPFEEDPKVR
ncbi:MAG: hypothetical protein WKF31_07955 [Thermoleophilaceae bacterium]